MIITTLLIGLALAALTMPTAPEKFAAVVFVLVIVTHDLFLSETTGITYYGSAALFDLAIVVLLSGVRMHEDIVLNLQRICMVFIAVNGLGWIAWMVYLPPEAYNATCTMVYVWALLTLIKRTWANVGGDTMVGGESDFYLYHFPRGMGFNKHGGQT